MVVNKKVLIIGCGNIGALYDFKKEGIKTHVKAFSQNSDFQIFLYDQNPLVAEEIATHYGLSFLEDLQSLEPSRFDVVVISTPTDTHFDYLKRFLQMQTPVIVCEKPVSDSVDRLDELKALRASSSSKVLVNYFRRFHPCYKRLKEVINKMEEPLTNIQITYQRGFSNNASHALDLLYFFWGAEPLEDVIVSGAVFDEFENDPTINLSATFQSVPVILQGLQNVRHSFFELKFWFEKKMIAIERNGQRISFFRAGENSEFRFYLPLEEEPSPFAGINATENAMQYLVESVVSLLDDPGAADNFDSSLAINYQTLKIIKSICRN